MTGGPDDGLVEALSALASSTRLALMRTLRTPQVISEIRVPNDDDGRPLTRQTLRRHVDHLLDAGLIRESPTTRSRGDTVEFLVRPQRIFLISEELKRLARLRPATQRDDRTEQGEMPEGAAPAGPSLVLVKGIDEGAFFGLTPAGEGQAWRIGRQRGVEVPLEYDPTVSAENARVRFVDGRYVLEDVPGSLNGTRLNFGRLGSGERTPLEHGDLVGVGRSLLLFWSKPR